MRYILRVELRVLRIVCVSLSLVSIHGSLARTVSSLMDG